MHGSINTRSTHGAPIAAPDQDEAPGGMYGRCEGRRRKLDRVEVPAGGEERVEANHAIGGDRHGLHAVRGEGQAHGEGHMARHDGVATPEVALDVGQMHGATLALANSRGLAEQLGHQRAKRRAAGDGVAVVTVVRDDVVIGRER